MARLVGKHPLLTYFALTFAISWGGALLAIGRSGGMRGTTPASDPRFAYALVAMLLGPSVTGISLTALLHGRRGLRALLSRSLRWRVGARWYAAALLTAPLLMGATLFALSSTSPAFIPSIATSGQKGLILGVGLGVGLAAGLFEELGWTGFAIPTLRRRRSVFGTGLIVGVWWSAWHLLPNVWSSRAAAGELPVSVYLAATGLGVFVGYLTAFRIFMVWVYERTQSLSIAMLLHASFTASLLILDPLDISGAHLLAYSFALASALWVLVAAIGARSGWRLEQKRSWSAPRAA